MRHTDKRWPTEPRAVRFGRGLSMAAVALALAVVVACNSTSPYFGDTTPPREQVLTLSNMIEPRSLDPHRALGDYEANITSNLFDCLTTYDPRTSEPLPSLATSWEHNADATVWTFHLRSDAGWTDGAPLTADDFVYSWRRIVAPATASPAVSPYLYYVRNGEAINKGRIADVAELGVRAVDRATLEVTLERPTPFFLSLTSWVSFAPLPRQAIERWGGDWIRPEHIVTSGPFRLVSHVPYDRIVLAKWDGWWGAADVALERVVILPVEDLNTVVNLYKANYIQVTWGAIQTIPSIAVAGLRDKADFRASPMFGVYYYSLNVKRPPLDNVLVRRALNLAIDKRAICERVLRGGQLPAETYVPHGVPGYPHPPGIGHDPDEARRLLAEAGYPGGRGFRPIEICFNTSDQHRQIAEAIQAEWKQELGIQVELRNQEWQTFSATRDRRDYDVARSAYSSSEIDPDEFVTTFTSDTTLNIPGWVDPAYVRLIDSADRDADPARRLAKIAEAESLLLDAMPIIPIYFLSSLHLQKPFVRGWYDNPLDQHPLRFVSIDTAWRPSD